MANIFREARELLHTKNGSDMTEEEQELVCAAMIPLFLLPEYEDIHVGEGLDKLAKIVDGNKQ